MAEAVIVVVVGRERLHRSRGQQSQRDEIVWPATDAKKGEMLTGREDGLMDG